MTPPTAPFAGFGFSVEDGGRPKALDEMLRALKDAGFTHVELDPTAWDVIFAGRVNGGQLARFVDVVDRHRDTLRFTLHGAREINLFDTTERELHQRLLRSSLEIARAVGAEAMAYHPGARLFPPTGASVPMAELMKYERDALSAAGDEIAGWGGRLGIETWYMVGDVGYSYAIWPEQLARQAAAIAHPAVGVCLDFGHLFLAAHWFGFDFNSAVAELAPHVNHFHVHDVFAALTPTGNAELGHGDLHLPPGWGAIPFDQIFATTEFPLRPVFNVELLLGRRLRAMEYIDTVLAESLRLADLRQPEATRTSRRTPWVE